MKEAIYVTDITVIHPETHLETTLGVYKHPKGELFAIEYPHQPNINNTIIDIYAEPTPFIQALDLLIKLH